MLPKTYTVAIVNINIVLALESDKRTGASPAKFLLLLLWESKEGKTYLSPQNIDDRIEKYES